MRALLLVELSLKCDRTLDYREDMFVGHALLWIGDSNNSRKGKGTSACLEEKKIAHNNHFHTLILSLPLHSVEPLNASFDFVFWI